MRLADKEAVKAHERVSNRSVMRSPYTRSLLVQGPPDVNRANAGCWRDSQIRRHSGVFVITASIEHARLADALKPDQFDGGLGRNSHSC